MKRTTEKAFEPENQAMNSSSSSEQASTMERPVVPVSGDATTNDAIVAELRSKRSKAHRECLHAIKGYLECAKTFASNLNSMASVSYSKWIRPLEDVNAELPLTSRRVFTVYCRLKPLEDNFWVTRHAMATAQRRLDEFTRNLRRASEQESTVTDTMDVDDSSRSEPIKTKKQKTKK